MRLTNCSGCETRSLNWQRPGEGLAEGVDEGRRNDCFRPKAVFHDGHLKRADDPSMPELEIVPGGQTTY